MKSTKLLDRISEVLKTGAPVVTAADIKHGVVQRVQLYFESEGEAVMDVINKDDLVQNFPDEGMYALTQNENQHSCEVKKIEMFEGEEDMFFRTDGTATEADEFGGVPSVTFIEAVEALATMKL